MDFETSERKQQTSYQDLYDENQREENFDIFEEGEIKESEEEDFQSEPVMREGIEGSKTIIQENGFHSHEIKHFPNQSKDNSEKDQMDGKHDEISSSSSELNPVPSEEDKLSRMEDKFRKSSHDSDKKHRHRSRSPSHSRRRDSSPSSRSRSERHERSRHSSSHRDRGRKRHSSRQRSPSRESRRNRRSRSRSRDRRSRHSRSRERRSRSRDRYSHRRDKRSEERKSKRSDRIDEKTSQDEESKKRKTSESPKAEDAVVPIEEPRKPEEDEEYKERVAQQLQQIEQEDEEERIRKARERRRAILAKHKTQPAQEEPIQQEQKQVDSSQTQKEEQHPVQQESEEKEKEEEQPEKEINHVKEKVEAQLEGSGFQVISNEEKKNEEPATTKGGVYDGNAFDMFAQTPVEGVEVFAPKMSEVALVAANISEVVDDPEGYYCFRIGEVLNGRYSLLGGFGKGVFSTVVRAKDLENNGKEVAIKVLRNNEAMKRMGFKEVELLREIAKVDPEGKYNIVRLLDSFEDRDHLCLVFEALNGGNLREVLRKYGTKIGLNIVAVKVYAQKLMLALKLLKKCRIMHADIKLDNILVNEAKTSVKLADLGSASSVTENTITPYLVSRFYRAPEIILGLPYSYEIDMWSVGCCLYELCTGKILFPGKTNNEMLYFFMEVSGPVPKKMLKKGEYVSQHFDEQSHFKRLMKDEVTGKEYIKICTNIKKRDLKEELLNSPFELSPKERRMILQLHDLLSQIFVLDPQKRISISDALRHPFIISSE